MKGFLIAGVLAWIISVVLFKQNTRNAINSPVVRQYLQLQRKAIVRCAPDWNSFQLSQEEVRQMVPLPGWGNHLWKVSTQSDSAQFYFNQGMNMYYGFHLIEAMASFKKAQLFDSTCAMLFWAEALAYGPNINDYGYSASPEALRSIQKAMEYSANIPLIEKQLVTVMASRYSADSSKKRVFLNQSYANGMKTLHEENPIHADIHALYVDALMLQHPWDLWDQNGKPRSWTNEIVDQLEKLLQYSPEHPGANHYYIHAMEPSPSPSKAMESAKRLGNLTPGISHLVHMPSHIYLRTGHYTEGSTVNESAVAGFRKYESLYPAAKGNDFLYSIHNLHMQTNCAMMNGRLAYAIQSAEACRKSIDSSYLSLPAPTGSYMQYIYMIPVLVNVRFGLWNEILKDQAPDTSLVFANIIWHFGRGMAYAGKKDPNAATAELRELRTLMKHKDLVVPFTPFSPAIDAAKVAEQLLTGTVERINGRLTSAIDYFNTAVGIEQKMVYNEPKDWLLNPKQYLGAALLEAEKLEEAERAFKKDLNDNNENGWSLWGLHLALMGQEKMTEASSVLTRYKKAFAKSDITLTRPVF